MAKLVLNDVENLGGNPNAAALAINTNSAAIEAALENTLSRDGSAPNQMEAQVDMNGFRILNLGAPVNPNDAARLADLTSVGSVIITAGNGLTGGGSIATDLSLAVGAGAGIVVTADAVALDTSGVTPGSYTRANITVDTYGRVTAAASGTYVNPSLVFVGASTVAGAAATDIVISSLDLGAHECYEIDLILDNATGSAITVSMLYNSDTTATNYDSRIATAGAASTLANTATIGQVLATSTSYYHLTIKPDFDGRPRTLLTGSSGNTTLISDQVGIHLWRTVANVTQITIRSSVASGFSIGSKIQVWKRTAS